MAKSKAKRKNNNDKKCILFANIGRKSVQLTGRWCVCGLWVCVCVVCGMMCCALLVVANFDVVNEIKENVYNQFGIEAKRKLK